MHSLKLSPPIGRGPFIMQILFLTVSVVSSLKNTHICAVAWALVGTAKIQSNTGQPSSPVFLFFWILDLALNLSSLWYYFRVWYEIVPNLFFLSVGDQTSQNYSWKKLFFLCCVVFEPVSKSTGHECMLSHLDCLICPFIGIHPANPFLLNQVDC